VTRALLAIALVIAGGCRTRPLDSPQPAADGGGGDGQPNGCMSHSYQAVPLVALDALSSASANMGQSARVRASVALRPCDVPADFTVDVQPGNATDFVALTAHAWIGSRDCGAAMPVARPIEVEPSASNPSVAVHDGAPGGTLTLRLGFGPPLAMQCDPRASLAPCELTCQCMAMDPLSRCLPSSGGARCGRPCAEDVECDAAQTCEPLAPGGVQLVCGPPSTACCAQTCGFGQACDHASCACIVTGTPTSSPCACATDCAAGTLCNGAVQHCFNPCAVVGDCPKPDVAACDHGICSYFVN